jgi:hypothetical protein
LRNFAAKNFPTVEESVKVKIPSRARGIVHGVIGTAMTKGINVMPAIVPARKINK